MGYDAANGHRTRQYAVWLNASVRADNHHRTGWAYPCCRQACVVTFAGQRTNMTEEFSRYSMRAHVIAESKSRHTSPPWHTWRWPLPRSHPVHIQSSFLRELT